MKRLLKLNKQGKDMIFEDKKTENPINSFLWKLLERTLTQGIKFIVQVVLARILLPTEYGIVALIAIFISVADVLVQSGLNIALIQKKDADDVDFSSVFYASISLSVVVYIVLYVSAPIIAEFYGEEILISVVRVFGLIILVNAINSVQVAYISRKLNFRSNFISSLAGTAISGIISIWMAVVGYGVWAMVVQQLIQQLVSVTILFFLVKWRPTKQFSTQRLRTMFSYGWKVMVASFVALLTEKAYSLLIGKVYNSETLGYYDRGHQFPFVIIGNINTSINTVLLPSLSKKQSDILAIKGMTRTAISLSSFFVIPAIAGLIAISKPLVVVLLTEKWLMCVPFLQMECLFYATLPLMSANGQAARAIGRSDIGLILEVTKTVLTLICLLLFYKCGILTIVGLRVLISFIMVIISSAINERLIDYKISEWMHDVLPSILLSIIMGVAVYLVQLIGLSNVLTLILQILSGTVIYFGLASLLKFNSMLIVMNYIKRLNVERK